MTVTDLDNLELFAILHESDAEDKSAIESLKARNPIAYHLSECKNVAARQARETFAQYHKALELAFNFDLRHACSRSPEHLTHPPSGTRVEKVLEGFRRDLGEMTQTLTEISALTQKVAKRRSVLSKRAVISNQGQSRLRAAKIDVYKQVMQRTHERSLPSSVLLFLLQPWTDYLCFTHLRFGGESNELANALTVMDRVLWAIEPKRSPSDIKLQAELREPLGVCVRAGLRAIRYDSQKTEKMIADLERLYESAVEGASSPAASPELVATLKAKASKHAYHYDPPKSANEVLEREMMERLKKLEFGSIFRFSGGRLLRLAWYNARSSNYMLVDDTAGENRLMAGRDLARALLGNHAVIVSGDFRKTKKNRPNQPRKKHVIPGLHAACWGLL